MKVKTYSVTGPIHGLIKQHAVWAEEGSVIAPLIYLQRPKWISNDDQWEKIVSSISLDLPAGFKVGGL